MTRLDDARAVDPLPHYPDEAREPTRVSATMLPPGGGLGLASGASAEGRIACGVLR